MTDGFQVAWAKATRDAALCEPGDVVSPELEGMASSLYRETLRQPVDSDALKSAIERILEFLCSPTGRTEINCLALSWFLEVDNDWEGDWRVVPEHLRLVLAQMGSVMSVADSVKLAAYRASPEELLAQVRRLNS